MDFVLYSQETGAALPDLIPESPIPQSPIPQSPGAETPEPVREAA